MNKQILKPLKKPYSTVQYEPKFEHRFIVEFPKDFNILSYVVNSITKPIYKSGSWSDRMKVELLDPISPSTTSAIFQLISSSKTEKPFILLIKSLDPVGNVVETLMVNINKIEEINFGSLTYHNTDELQKIIMYLEVKNCILT